MLLSTFPSVLLFFFYPDLLCCKRSKVHSTLPRIYHFSMFLYCCLFIIICRFRFVCCCKTSSCILLLSLVNRVLLFSSFTFIIPFPLSDSLSLSIFTNRYHRNSVSCQLHLSCVSSSSLLLVISISAPLQSSTIRQS